MEENHDTQKPDLTQESKMTDNNTEDDTEDYIQPSQPLSFRRTSVESTVKKDLKDDEISETCVSTIEESVVSATEEQPSCDFISSSESPIIKEKVGSNEKREDNSKDKLSLDDMSLIKTNSDLFSSQSQLNDTLDVAELKLPVTPFVPESQTASSVPGSPHHVDETLGSVDEATVAGSGKGKEVEETKSEEAGTEEAKKCESSSPENGEEVKKCSNSTRYWEETIDDPSPRFLDNSGMASLLREDNIKDVVENKTVSQPSCLDDTVDVEDIKSYYPYSSEKTDMDIVVNAVPSVTDGLSSNVDSDTEGTPIGETLAQKGIRLKDVLKNISEEEMDKLQKHSTPEDPLSRSLKINESTSSIENGTPKDDDCTAKQREINFTICLQLNCQVALDPIKNQTISKKILHVKELIKKQPKLLFIEPNSESPYKTKRLSHSSSGSVYSDKTGLPYELPGRSSASSAAAAENSSSSSLDLAKHIKIVERQVWVNEYMIPTALDEILPRFIEQSNRATEIGMGSMSAKRKMLVRVRKKSHRSHPLDNVLESSLTEPSSGNTSDVRFSSSSKSGNRKVSGNFEDSKRESGAEEENEQDEEGGGDKREKFNEKTEKEMGYDKTLEGNQSVEGVMGEGLSVFARWTDKRYYPGKLNCKEKFDRWEVEFDDGTSKVIREDLILPLKWLTKGELVFALFEDKYASGKITDIMNEESKFKIELDDANEELIVNKSDLCLNEVMAGIIREKFKSRNKPDVPPKSSEIDFVNLVIGKRVREQRTPVRYASNSQPGSSTTNKRKSEEMATDKGTPKMKTPLRKKEMSSDKSAKKKAPGPDSTPEDFVEKIKAELGAGKESVHKTSEKSEGTRKRGRPLKNNSENAESSIKKFKQQSESKSSDGNSGSKKDKPKKSSKALIIEFEKETLKSTKKQVAISSDAQKASKAGKTPKSKEENVRSKGSGRFSRKNSTNKDGKKKSKKNS